MDGVGSRLGRASSRYGPAATASVFSGPVRKWKKRWVNVSPSAAVGSQSQSNGNRTSNGNRSTNGSSSHLVLFRWTPLPATPATAHDAANAGEEDPPKHRFRYTPIAVIEEQKRRSVKDIEDEAKASDISQVKDSPISKGNEPNANNTLNNETQVKKMIRSYHIEAEWLNKGHIPPFEEYFENSLISGGYNALATGSLLGMGEIAGTKEFQWITRVPKINRASMIIGRLADDIVSPEHEMQRRHVATGMECYMKQYNVSKEEVIEIFKKNIAKSWKDMNELFIKPTEVAIPIQKPVLNLARVIDVLYKYEDAYSINPRRLKGFVEMLFLELVPM